MLSLHVFGLIHTMTEDLGCSSPGYTAALTLWSKVREIVKGECHKPFKNLAFIDRLIWLINIMMFLFLQFLCTVVVVICRGIYSCSKTLPSNRSRDINSEKSHYTLHYNTLHTFVSCFFRLYYMRLFCWVCRSVQPVTQGSPIIYSIIEHWTKVRKVF